MQIVYDDIKWQIETIGTKQVKFYNMHIFFFCLMPENEKNFCLRSGYEENYCLKESRCEQNAVLGVQYVASTDTLLR